MEGAWEINRDDYPAPHFASAIGRGLGRFWCKRGKAANCGIANLNCRERRQTRSGQIYGEGAFTERQQNHGCLNRRVIVARSDLRSEGRNVFEKRRMCNAYSSRNNQAAIIALFRVIIPLCRPTSQSMPAVVPDFRSQGWRHGSSAVIPDGSWCSAPSAARRRRSRPTHPHDFRRRSWRGWPQARERCRWSAPANSICSICLVSESRNCIRTSSGLSRSEARPLVFPIAGIVETDFVGNRGTSRAEIPAPSVYASLTTAREPIVEPVHPKAMSGDPDTPR